MAKTSKAPYVTRADIEAYLSLEEQRKALQREANDIKKQSDEIADRLMEFTRANADKSLSLVRSGYVLAIKLVKGSVAWKQEFVRVAGGDAAEIIIAQAPPRETLTVQPA